MTLSTKIKIAAALLLLGGVSIGAGAFYMTSSTDRPEVIPEQTPPPAVVAPVETNFGFDPRIAPFVSDRTDMILTIDITKINLDALAADMQKELGQSKMDAPSAARINGMIQMGLFAGKQWIAGFKQAGGESFFMLSRSDELTIGSSGGSPSFLQLSGTMVFTADSSAAAHNLERYLSNVISRPMKVIGNSVVAESSSPAPRHIDPRPDPRPALAAALSASGDTSINVAINPSRLKQIIRKLMATGNMTPPVTDDEWVGLEYTSLQLVLPPAESPGMVSISHYKDPSSAEIGKAKAIERMNRVKPLLGKGSPLTEQMQKFIATEKFTVNGSDVVATLDLHAYWDLVFAAVRIGTQPPATRPHGLAN